MIYTVTLNPSLDYHLYLTALSVGNVHRTQHTGITFGGKGINVSVILSRLGIPNTALGFVAGFTGDELCARLTEAGVRQDMIRLENGYTRINVKLHAADETEINAAGATVTSDAMEVLLGKLELLNGGDELVLSGSIPPSLPIASYGNIMARLKSKGVRCVVDAEGDALLATLPYAPFLIKPNLHELSMLAGERLTTDAEIISAARGLQARGAQNVLVSLGARGAILLDADGGCHIAPAFVGNPVNTVGAGDSMVAGFLAGLPEGYASALRMGLAAGCATAFAEGLGEKETILALYHNRS